MKKIEKIISVLLVLAMFSAFAVGSSSSEKASESNDGGGSSVEENTTIGASEATYELGEGIVKTWTDSIGSGWIMVAIPVKNTGTKNLYLKIGTMDIEDENGELVKTLNMVSAMPQVIKPGETSYYFEETLYDGEKTENLKVVPHVEIESATVDLIRYDLSELGIKDDEYGGVSLTGRVENNTEETGTMVYVVVNFYDKDGNFIYQDFTILDNDLNAGEKIGFETTSESYDFSSSDVDKYEVFAYPDQYQF